MPFCLLQWQTNLVESAFESFHKAVIQKENMNPKDLDANASQEKKKETNKDLS